MPTFCKDKEPKCHYSQIGFEKSLRQGKLTVPQIIASTDWFYLGDHTMDHGLCYFSQHGGFNKQLPHIFFQEFMRLTTWMFPFSTIIPFGGRMS